MAMLQPFSDTAKTTHNSHTFAFKLSPTNFGYWKAIIQPFLITNNLIGYVDGSIPCPSAVLETTVSSSDTPPPKSQPNPNHQVWLSNDAHIRMLLLSTISETAFGHVQHTTTSRELWLALERAYAPNTISREFTLKQQLLKIEMKSDESPDAYLERAREYADSLANIGEPVKDKDLVLLVVAGLRDEYHSLKGNIISRQQPPAFSELHALLSDHDFLVRKTTTAVPPTQAFTAVQNHQTSTTTNTGPPLNPTIQALQQLVNQLSLQSSSSAPQQQQAYYSAQQQQQRSRYSRGRGNRRGRGSFHQNNRSSPMAPTRNQFPWASTQTTVYGTCNRCGIGHIPSHCPNRDPSTLRGNSPSANYVDTRSQASPFWKPDTGATGHASPDLSSFDYSEPYLGGDNLHVGDGQVYTHYPPHGSQQ